MPEMGPVGSRRAVTVVTSLIFVILLLLAVRWAGGFLKPVALALFIIAVTWPIKNALQKFMPPLLALAVTVIATIVVFIVFTMLVVWGFSRMATSFINAAWQLQIAYQDAVKWLGDNGISVASSLNDVFNVSLLVRTIQQVTGQASTTLSFWLVVLAYVVLGLTEVDKLRGKLGALQQPDFAATLIRIADDTAKKFGRYMLVRTAMSAMTGLLFWGSATVTGLDFPVEWGVIAFALNYIPFIGSVIATVFPSLYGVIQFENWETALALFICLNLIQFIIGNYVEPMVSGSTLSISPFIVVFSIFFWTFMWGLFGTFLGVPITIALLTVCEHIPSLNWVAEILGGRPRRHERVAAEA
ncbi:AI-2E family transporter [Martelella endophytica]|uniref:Permease n=1 Tax=Martelella endophytica TaxID=1486262 RepID=A0A0D5LUM6_MAREN|nr:AI-2E family transporter [Martelella endophytica]AJY47447.1 permease [Martelella endophytica]